MSSLEGEREGRREGGREEREGRKGREGWMGEGWRGERMVEGCLTILQGQWCEGHEKWGAGHDKWGQGVRFCVLT